MIASSRCVSLMLLLSGIGAPAYTFANVGISVSDIQAGKAAVLGKLGKPLGTPLEIVCSVRKRATPAGAHNMGPPSPVGELYVIEVTSVNSKVLEKPVIITFMVPRHVAVRVAEHEDALKKLVHALKTPGSRMSFRKESNSLETEIPLSEAAADDFQKKYVNSVHTLIGYETGGFHGEPENMPHGYGFYGSGAFQFISHFVVLGEKYLDK